jgi:hypothetical protein
MVGAIAFYFSMPYVLGEEYLALIIKCRMKAGGGDK